MNFEKTFTSLEKSQVRLDVTVDQKDVQEQYQNLLKEYVKKVQIPGFRKGKVPAKILEQKYGEALKADAASELVEQTLETIFKESNEFERPLPYAQPAMDSAPTFNPDAAFSFSVTYDVFPKVQVTTTEGFSVTIPDVSVTEDDIQAELVKIQKRNALVMDCADDTLIENEHIITINYCELDKDGAVIPKTEREDFTFTVGSGQNLFKLDADVLGMKKGETKEVCKTFGDDADASIKNTTKTIRVTVSAVKRQDLPEIDDDLAQDVNEKFTTLQDLKDDIKKNLTFTVERRINEMRITELLKAMVKANDFELPQSMVAMELESRWRMMAQQFRLDPKTLEQMMAASGQSSKEETFKAWTGESEERLKGRIIVETLLKERNIEVSDADVEEEFKKIANRAEVSEEEVKKHYENPQEKEYLIADMKERQLFDQIAEKSTITKGSKESIEALFTRGQE